MVTDNIEVVQRYMILSNLGEASCTLNITESHNLWIGFVIIKERVSYSLSVLMWPNQELKNPNRKT